MDLGLKGKVAAVAAASDGLGKAVATLLAQEGAAVAICSRDIHRIQRAARDIEKAAQTAPLATAQKEPPAAGASPPKIFAFAVDLSTPSGPERFIRETAQQLGGLDILVANNGGPPPGRAIELTDEAWQKGIDITLMSGLRLARAAIPHMLAKQWGRIIFITSISVKQPIENLAVSTALRCGIAGYAKCLADELAPSGITVNSVAPGSTATARLAELLARHAQEKGLSLEEARAEAASKIPMKRIGRPEELAAAVAFLASPQAGYITGVVLPVDGGQSRSII